MVVPESHAGTNTSRPRRASSQIGHRLSQAKLASVIVHEAGVPTPERFEGKTFGPAQCLLTLLGGLAWRWWPGVRSASNRPCNAPAKPTNILTTTWNTPKRVVAVSPAVEVSRGRLADHPVFRLLSDLLVQKFSGLWVGTPRLHTQQRWYRICKTCQ